MATPILNSNQVGASAAANKVLQTNGSISTWTARAPITVYAAGTAYTLTNSSAALDFGTTDPVLTVNVAGTYLLLARVRVDLNAATFAANQTLTLKLRRTNNTAADLTSGSTSYVIPIVTTITQTLDIVELPPVIYTTANADDAVTIFGDLTVAPGAGTVTAVQAEIVAIRLY